MKLKNDKIKTERKKLGLTQEQLAEMSKVSLRTIQRAEKENVELRGESLSAICNTLKIKPDSVYVREHDLIDRVLGIIFLIVLNMLFMIVLGYLTLDSNANLNSRLGAGLFVALSSYLVVMKTPGLTGANRLLKYGMGYVLYMLIAVIFIQIGEALLSGLIPFSFLALAILYYGNQKRLIES